MVNDFSYTYFLENHSQESRGNQTQWFGMHQMSTALTMAGVVLLLSLSMKPSVATRGEQAATWMPTIWVVLSLSWVLKYVSSKTVPCRSWKKCCPVVRWLRHYYREREREREREGGVILFLYGKVNTDTDAHTLRPTLSLCLTLANTHTHTHTHTYTHTCIHRHTHTSTLGYMCVTVRVLLCV